jgi:cephalosporin-C deacetylase
MPLTDMSLTELFEYRPAITPPEDFDDFWGQTLDQARAQAWQPRLEPAAPWLAAIRVDDLTYAGFDGQPVRAWLLRPMESPGELPVVIGFNGYGGGRGRPHEHLAWLAAGYGYAFMDTRGQGGWWGGGGDTPDPVGHGPSGPGFATRGLEDPHNHYYRRVFTDAARLVETIAALPGVGPIAVTGVSQGGGIAIAAAGLVPQLVAAALPDVPFGCDWRTSVERSAEDPYAEVARFLSVHPAAEKQTFATLSYLDAVHHAARASAPALFSVGLMDPVCLPSTVFAAFHSWAGEHRIEPYPFGGHEGGGPRHFEKQVEFVNGVIGR